MSLLVCMSSFMECSEKWALDFRPKAMMIENGVHEIRVQPFQISSKCPLLSTGNCSFRGALRRALGARQGTPHLKGAQTRARVMGPRASQL